MHDVDISEAKFSLPPQFLHHSFLGQDTLSVVPLFTSTVQLSGDILHFQKFTIQLSGAVSHCSRYMVRLSGAILHCLSDLVPLSCNIFHRVSYAVKLNRAISHFLSYTAILSSTLVHCLGHTSQPRDAIFHCLSYAVQLSGIFLSLSLSHHVSCPVCETSHLHMTKIMHFISWLRRSW